MKRTATPESIGKARALNARYKLPRQHVLEAFGLARFPSGSAFAIKNLMTLLDQREDLDRVHELVTVYAACFPLSRSLTPTGFYNFYKKNWFTRGDVLAFRIYEQVLVEFTDEQVSVWPFMGAGEALISKLEDWATVDSADTVEELLSLFFYLVLPRVQEWQAYLLVQPKSILDKYGWHTFLKEIKAKYGDKWHFLRQSETTVVRIDDENSKLLFLREVRQTLLDEGDLVRYDLLGREISRDGELAVFERYNLTYGKGEQHE